MQCHAMHPVPSRLGVMSLLDEELALPKQSELAYVEKLHARFGDRQPEVLEAAALSAGGCSPKCWRLQPYV